MTASTDTPIHNVSDTALWVAYYRAQESEKPNPLFRDPLAKTLVGDRGAAIAASMNKTSAHTRINVLIRTVIIDRFVQELALGGVQAVVNLGAGLDTRPYRMTDLPPGLKWIEVDYPHVMDLKNRKLAHEKPHVQLERISLDLADRSMRQKLFARIAGENKNVVVLTEGVLPYLSEQQVAELADDIKAHASFRRWIADYIAPFTYKFIQTPQRMKAMKNAPFRFFPPEPERFFESHGWMRERIQYIPEVALTFGIHMPVPWWAFLFKPFVTKERARQFLQMSGYMVMKPS